MSARLLRTRDGHRWFLVPQNAPLYPGNVPVVDQRSGSRSAHKAGHLDPWQVSREQAERWLEQERERAAIQAAGVLSQLLGALGGPAALAGGPDATGHPHRDTVVAQLEAAAAVAPDPLLQRALADLAQRLRASGPAD